MTTPAKAQNIATQRPDLVTFYLPKERILSLGQAIAALQQRDDLSGKFARKTSYQRRHVLAAVEELNEDRLEMVKRHAEKFPVGHAKAGEFTPVYAQKNDGSPLFKTDANGNDTDERVVVQDQYNLVDVAAFNAEWKESMKEVVAIALPAMKVGELEAFSKIRGQIMDALVDIEEGAETTKKPEGWADQPALALVKDEPPVPPAAEEVATEERSAP